MKHIRQTNSVGTNTYTIVKAEGYTDDQLPTHPSITEHPELFDIADNSEIPPYYQHLIYQPDNS